MAKGPRAMSMNASYRGPSDCPSVLPVFPLPGALLLPRGEMPLNIFEPRYVAMIDDALRGTRVIGVIQPESSGETAGGMISVPKLHAIGCAGRITQFAETGDGRYLLQLTGIARFRIEGELKTVTAYRQCRVAFAPFIDDFTARKGEAGVNRDAVLAALQAFLKARHIQAD